MNFLHSFSGAGGLKWAGAVLFILGLFTVVLLATSRDSLPYRLWARYVNYLETQLQLMFLPTRGRNIALGQLGGLTALAALNAAVAPIPGSVVLALAICFIPPWQIKRMKATRTLAIEGQLNTFTVSLSNALKITPSLGDALRISGDLLAQPLRDEIVYAVKTMRFGASVEQALTLTASRIGSPDVDMVFSALLIGRNIGGDLPTILDTTAASIREMTRLQQVLRAKTAEGRAQIWVLAMFPLVLIVGLGKLMPGYFDPLTKTAVGYVLTALIVLFWGGSILLGRNIMKVDM
jgi:tight adherence protein B